MAKSEFDSFDPHGYLEEYYLEVGPENQFLLDMSALAYKQFPEDSVTVLELGGGPTVYQLIGSVACAKEIHFTDYLQTNLDEVSLWLNSDPGAFDWDKFIAASPVVAKQPVGVVREALKSKITKLSPINILTDKYSAEMGDQYDVVSSFFASDGITHSVEDWRRVLENIASFINNDGHLLMTGVFGSKEWKSGSQIYPSTNLNRALLLTTLDQMNLRVKLFATIESETSGAQGYDEAFFVKAQKL